MKKCFRFFRSYMLLLFPLAAVLCLTGWTLADDEAADEPKEAPVIELAEGNIRLTAPTEWEVKKPRTRIVEYEFAVPPVEGDQQPGRVTVMGAGGGVENNIQRWISQFEQPDGSDSKEVAMVEKLEINDTEVHRVSITGNYRDMPGGGPFTKTEVVLREDYRMLAAVIVTKNSGHYFVKFYGPKKTVDAQEESFDKMLKSLAVKDDESAEAEAN